MMELKENNDQQILSPLLPQSSFFGRIFFITKCYLVNFILFLVFVIFSSTLSAQTEQTKPKKVLEQLYLTEIFAHLHDRPDIYSAAKTTLACGHVVNILQEDPKKKSVPNNNLWAYLEASGRDGYMIKTFLSPQRPECFQESYAVFFELLNLEVSDLYYWGRLQELILRGRSRVK